MLTMLQSEEAMDCMRAAGRLARRVLEAACREARPGSTTQSIDRLDKSDVCVEVFFFRLGWSSVVSYRVLFLILLSFC